MAEIGAENVELETVSTAETLESELQEAINTKDLQQVKDFLQQYPSHTVSEKICTKLIDLTFESGKISLIEALLDRSNIQFSEDTIEYIAKKKTKKNLKLSKLVIELLATKLEGTETLKQMIASALNNFAAFCDRSYTRKVMEMSCFQKAAVEHVRSIHKEIEPTATELSSEEDCFTKLVLLIKHDDVSQLENLYNSGQIKVLSEMNEELFNKICNEDHKMTVVYKFKEKANSVESDATEETATSVFQPFHYKFPLLCAQFGKFKLIQKFFSLTINHDSLPHAAYIISKLGIMKSRAYLSDTQKMELLETVRFLDVRITSIFEQIILDNREINIDITEEYIDKKSEILGNKSIMDILIENNCTSFINSDWSMDIVEHLWDRAGFKKNILANVDESRCMKALLLVCIILIFLFYIPIMLTTLLILMISLLPLSLIKLVSLCKTDSEEQEVGNEESSSCRCDDKQCLCCQKCIRSLDVLYEWFEITLFPPFLRFIMDSFVQLTFIIVISYFVIRDIHFYVSGLEIFIYCYIVCYILEEIKQLVALGIRDYVDVWNTIDWCAIILLTIGFFIKFFHSFFSSWQHKWQIDNCTFQNFHVANATSDECLLLEANDDGLYVARVFLVIGTIFCFIKFLRFTSAFRKFGPTLKMIGDMILIDLLPFMFILSVFMFAFGTAFSALAYPNGYTKENMKQNGTNYNFFSYSKGFLFAFYGIAGQYSILDLTANQANPDNDELANHGKPHNLSQYFIAYILLPIYIIIVNILLLNLLIALFSSTVQKIEQDSNAYWHILKYQLVKDYETRSVLPPPLNILNLVQKVLIAIFRLIQTDEIQRKRESEINMFFILFSFVQGKAFKNKKIKDDEEERVGVKSELELMEDRLTARMDKFEAMLKEIMEKLSNSKQN